MKPRLLDLFCGAATVREKVNAGMFDRPTRLETLADLARLEARMAERERERDELREKLLWTQKWGVAAEHRAEAEEARCEALTAALREISGIYGDIGALSACGDIARAALAATPEAGKSEGAKR